MDNITFKEYYEAVSGRSAAEIEASLPEQSSIMSPHIESSKRSLSGMHNSVITEYLFTKTMLGIECHINIYYNIYMTI